jgi:lysozyme family protein
MGVNAGLVRATKLLQQTLGVAVDGALGPRTIAAATSADWNALYTGVRIAFYERLIENDPSQIVWRNGWRNRGLSFVSLTRLTCAVPSLRAAAGQPLFGHTGKAYY